MRKLSVLPGVETLEQNLRAFTDNIQDIDTKSIMAKYGLVNFDPNKWYPEYLLLNALNELADNPNTSPNWVAIGLESGKIVPIPPNLKYPTLGQVLIVWNSLYQYLRRNGDAGELWCEKVSDMHYKMTFTDLYPDDFSFGIIYGYCRRFLPRGTSFQVYYDKEVTPRNQGGEITIINVSW